MMNRTVTCGDLSALLQDQRRGYARSPAAATHLGACARCREALAVDAAMHQVAIAGPGRLPPAGAVLLRARLAARRRSAERAQAPLLLCQWLTLAAALAGVAFVLGAGWPALGGHLDLPTSLIAVGLTALVGLPFVRRLQSALE